MTNPYEAPKSTTSATAMVDTSKRPGWVWAISILYGLSTIYTPISFYLVYSGALPLTGAQKEYFNSLGMFDWILVAVGSVIMLSAVVSLFLLKRVTIKLWGLAIIVTVLNSIYSMIAKNWLAAMDIPSLVGVVIGFALVVAIFFYTKRLDARGYLK